MWRVRLREPLEMLSEMFSALGGHEDRLDWDWPLALSGD